MSVNRPVVSFNIVPDFVEQKPEPRRTLIVGQKLSTGSATAGNILKNVQNLSNYDSLFGAKSMLTHAINLFRKINKETPLDVWVLADDAGGTKASATITFSGTATRAGTIRISVLSKNDALFQLDVSSTTTPTQLATALAAKINAAKIPCTATSTAGVVTVTFAHNGLEGNFGCLHLLDDLATGISTALTPFTGGTTNPSTAAFATKAKNSWYWRIAIPQSYVDTDFLTELEARYNTENDTLDGILLQVKAKDYATALSDLALLNSKCQDQQTYRAMSTTTEIGNGTHTPGLSHAAGLAALDTLRVLDGADLSDYYIANGAPLDSIGGPAIASLPYHNIPLPWVKPMTPESQWEFTEEKALQDAGASYSGTNSRGTAVIQSFRCTTYKFDAAGSQDPTFHFVENVDSYSIAREYIVRNTRTYTASMRLTDGDIVAGRAFANEAAIIDFMIGRYVDLSGPDYALVPAGAGAVAFFKKNITVKLDLPNGKIIITFKLRVNGQVREIQAVMAVGIGFTSVGFTA
jgi:phage tail sheath gpL-like